MTDDEVTALLQGRTPSGRTDLESVAAVVEALRLTSFEAPPRPSAELAARLDLERATWISEPAGGLPADATRQVSVAEAAPARGRVQMFFSWFAGLGLAAKIVLGATGAAVATVGAGAAHVLPPAIQSTFDEAVTTVVGDEEPVEDTTGDVAEGTDETTTDETPVEEPIAEEPVAEEPVEEEPVAEEPVAEEPADEVKVNENAPAHAQAVQEAAHTKTAPGEHGKLVREAAHSNKDKAAEAPAEETEGAEATTGNGNGKKG